MKHRRRTAVIISGRRIAGSVETGDPFVLADDVTNDDQVKETIGHEATCQRDDEVDAGT